MNTADATAKLIPGITAGFVPAVCYATRFIAWSGSSPRDDAIFIVFALEN